MQQTAERIRELLELRGGVPAFIEVSGINRATVYRNLRVRPTLEFVFAVLDQHPDCNADWLLRGRGSMLNEPQQESPPAISDSTLRLAAQLLELDPETVRPRLDGFLAALATMVPEKKQRVAS
jgi:hypothetical protein